MPRKATAIADVDFVVSIEQKPDYFTDVAVFHEKFGLPHAGELFPPAPLAPDVLAFRLKFMIEELAEFARSQGADDIAARLDEVRDAVPSDLNDVPQIKGLADGADALVDLVYVALGTAHLMRLPFDECWAEVQRANMTKERATSADDSRSKRSHSLDVVKPEGWQGPNHWVILFKAATNYQGPSRV